MAGRLPATIGVAGASVVRPHAALAMWSASKVLPYASTAHAVRAFLFASATAAMFLPRRCSVANAQRLRRSVRCGAYRNEARAPCISSVRRCRSPRLLMPSSFARPPVECWRGTSPSHAASSRPLRNSVASPTAATSAVAVSTPESRRAFRRLFCVSHAAMAVCSSW